MIISIGVTAKNEALNLLKLLKSLRTSIQFAVEKLTTVEFEIHVILNDNTDGSEEILAKEAGIKVWHTTGGLVEAQRFFKNLKLDSPFLIFCDADILLNKECIYDLTYNMLNYPKIQVAYAEKVPLKPKKPTLLSTALYLYNLNNGYQNRRYYFNGQLFAIRNWYVPTAKELRWNAELNNNFLNLEAGIRCDDIYLSRYVLKNFGPESIYCAFSVLLYRPPETLQGMYRKYQRMRLEIERLNCFFPETVKTHEAFGKRNLQKKIIFSKPVLEIFYYTVFLSGLYLCKALYNFEKFYYSYFSTTYYQTWKPVLETKDLS